MRHGRQLTRLGLALALALALAGPANGAERPTLRWSPPALRAPVHVYVSTANRALKLDPSRDYVVHMPSAPLEASGGLTIAGGRNVVLIGGTIRIPWQGPDATGQDRRGLFIKEQRGTIHIEGLTIDGPDLSEGIDIDERLGAIVQLQNIRIVGVHARDELGFTDNHPDVIQSWGGPAELRIDRLTATTDYQGLFLHPTQFDRRAVLERLTLTNVQIGSLGGKAGYLLWQATPFSVTLQNVWLEPGSGKTLGRSLWPSAAAWPVLHAGAPANGAFVGPEDSGTGYRTPGYKTVLAGRPSAKPRRSRSHRRGRSKT